ncbi:MAG TPA: NmrA family NAD(P)-binding protein [Iamia sp.]
MNHTDPVLVLGASGKTGRRVADLLEAAGTPVRRASRTSPQPFEWADPATWPAALDGAGAAYVTYFPDLAAPGAEEVLDGLGGAVAAHGITRVVLLSGRGEPAAARSEAAFVAHVPTTTVVRCAWFDQNFTEGIFAPAVAEGRLRLPTPGTTREPFVDADDIAVCVAALLANDEHAGRRYELTGPEAISLDAVAATLAEATGHPVTYEPTTVEGFAAAMEAEGLAPEEAIGLAHALAEVFDGRSEATSDDTARLLGRPPRAFAAFARDVFARPERGAA